MEKTARTALKKNSGTIACSGMGARSVFGMDDRQHVREMADIHAFTNSIEQQNNNQDISKSTNNLLGPKSVLGKKTSLSHNNSTWEKFGFVRDEANNRAPQP